MFTADTSLCSVLPEEEQNTPRIIVHGAAALFAEENCGSLIKPRAPALSCHRQHWQPSSVLLGQNKLPTSSASRVLGFAVSQHSTLVES